eukprot:UN01994
MERSLFWSSVLVVFFGFMGSKPRHIEKYQEIFRECKNSLTIHAVYPLRNCRDTFKKYRIKYLAQNTLNYVANFIKQENTSNNNPIVIFYVFSNAGGILMAIINDLLCQDNKYKNMLNRDELFINGIVYESCPGLLKPTLNINHINCTLNALIPRIATYPKLAKYLLFAVNYTMAFIFYCVFKLGLFRIDLFVNFFEKLLCKNNPKILGIPSLFLYSNSDKSVFVNHIEMFIQMKRKALGKHLERDAVNQVVKTHNFDNSPHVQHYLKHTKQYKLIVLSFLNKIMQQNESMQTQTVIDI